MKCSLLTLSCYLDNELEARQQGELEAHLVGCERCQGGMDHLMEESARIADLAAVHVPDHSAHALLVQLNLIGAEDPLPEVTTVRVERRGRDRPADIQPWLGSRPGAALPWSARRDDYRPRRVAALREVRHDGDQPSDESAGEPAPDPSWATLMFADDPVSPQSALPFDNEALSERAPVLKGSTAHPGESVVPLPQSTPRREPTDSDPISSSWGRESARIPSDSETAWGPLTEDVRDEFTGPPRRADKPNILGRLRERIAMQRALSRSPSDEFDDSVEVVSGTGAPLRPPVRRPSRRGAFPAATPSRPLVLGETAGEAHLSGEAMPVDRWVRREHPSFHPEADHAVAGDGGIPEAAPSWPDDSAGPASRHSGDQDPFLDTTEPVTREEPPSRIPGWGDAVTSPVPAWVGDEDTAGPVGGAHPPLNDSPPRQAENALVPAGVGRHVQRLQNGAGANRRLALALVGVVLLTAAGLVTGKSRAVVTTANAPLATRPSTGSLPQQPRPVAGAIPRTSLAPPAASAVASPGAAGGVTSPQSLGDGASGFSLKGVRYGAHPGDYRVVFDLAGVGGGTPKSIVGLHDPQTVWVELFGVASGPVAPPDGLSIKSVTHLPSSTVPGATVYALSLARPMAPTASYVTGPLRLIVDLH